MSSEIMHMINKAKAEARVKSIEHTFKNFFNRNGKPLTIALGFLFLVGGWLIISSFKEKSEQQRCFSMLNLGISLQEKGDAKKAKEVFRKIHESNSCSGGVKPIASLRYAAITYTEDKKNEALVIYQEIIKDSDQDPFIRELATLLATRIQVADATQQNDKDYKKTLGTLKKAVSKSKVFKNYLKEQQGILEFSRGNLKESYQVFDELSKNSEVPEALKSRSQEMKKLINQRGFTETN